MSETTYTLESSSEEDDNSLVSTFTTGTDNAIVNTQVPTISISDETFVEADPLCGSNAHYNYQISISDLMVTDDQNTHFTSMKSTILVPLLPSRKYSPFRRTPSNISGAAQDGACFTVSHVGQNGAILGESDIVCAELTDLDDTGDPNGETDEKGCSSANQGAFTWMGLIGLIGLSMSRRRR